MQDARHLAQSDPELSSARGQAARHLLYLFEQDFGIALMKRGECNISKNRLLLGKRADLCSSLILKPVKAGISLLFGCQLIKLNYFEKNPEGAYQKNFCTSCGAKVNISNKICGEYGTKLASNLEKQNFDARVGVITTLIG